VLEVVLEGLFVELREGLGAHGGVDVGGSWIMHNSPDGKWIVFLSFSKEVAPSDHPFYKQVYLRSMSVEGGKPRVIAYVYGGQGTINVPSWSPDSRKVAFVSNTDMR